MKVRFKRTWFAPSTPHRPDALRSISGQRFHKGEHEVPDDLKEFLPPDAMIILPNDEAVRVDSPEMTLTDYDEARQSAEAFEQAEVAKEARRNNLKKARAAKAAKEKEGLNGDS